MTNGVADEKVRFAMGGIETEIAGERVILDADKALAWPAGETLFIADTHFGKDASARARGVPVPEGTTEADLNRISNLINRYQAKSIWILGDVFHSRNASEDRTMDRLRAWRDGLCRVGICMVPGNHDLRALRLADDIRIQIFSDGYRLGPWILTHAPCEVAAGHGLCGHVHPAVRLTGPTRQRLTLPCFLSSPDQTILPAFGGMTGSGQIKPGLSDRVWPVGAGTIFGPLPPPSP